VAIEIEHEPRWTQDGYRKIERREMVFDRPFRVEAADIGRTVRAVDRAEDEVIDTNSSGGVRESSPVFDLFFVPDGGFVILKTASTSSRVDSNAIGSSRFPATVVTPRSRSARAWIVVGSRVSP
jgi:hypothetical protein